MRTMVGACGQRRDLLKRLQASLWLLTDLMFVGFAAPAISAEQPLNMTQGVTEISGQVYDLHMLIFLYLLCNRCRGVRGDVLLHY